MKYEKLKLLKTKIEHRLIEKEEEIMYAARRIILKHQEGNSAIKELSKENGIELASAKEFINVAKSELKGDDSPLKKKKKL